MSVTPFESGVDRTGRHYRVCPICPDYCEVGTLRREVDRRFFAHLNTYHSPQKGNA